MWVQDLMSLVELEAPLSKRVVIAFSVAAPIPLKTVSESGRESAALMVLRLPVEAFKLIFVPSSST